MTSLYEYALAAAGNETSFPRSMVFSEFNDAMRTLMAQQALHMLDEGGSAPANATLILSAVSRDGEVVPLEAIPSPTPVGCLLMFRFMVSDTGPSTGVFGHSNPLWLTVNDASHPVVGMRRQSTPGNFELRTESLYLVVFTGSAWHVLSSLAMEAPADRAVIREVPAGGNLTLRAEHLNSSVLIQALASELTLTIPVQLLDRWPVHSWIEFHQQRFATVRIQFDGATSAVLLPHGSGNLHPAGVLLNNYVHFGLIRASPLDVLFIEYARGVR
jgi:hypothetical protein